MFVVMYIYCLMIYTTKYTLKTATLSMLGYAYIFSSECGDNQAILGGWFQYFLKHKMPRLVFGI